MNYFDLLLFGKLSEQAFQLDFFRLFPFGLPELIQCDFYMLLVLSYRLMLCPVVLDFFIFFLTEVLLMSLGLLPCLFGQRELLSFAADLGP